MATTPSVVPVGFYLGYSISSMQAAFLETLSVAGLGTVLFRRCSLISIIVIAAAVGCFGVFYTLYYTGYVGQYFSLFTVPAVLWYLFFEADVNRRAVWLLLSAAGTVLVYSSGFLLVALAMILGVVIVRVLLRAESLWSAGRTSILVVGISLLVIVLFGENVGGASELFSSRNPGYNYGIPNGLLIWSGLAWKYESFPALNWYRRFALPSPFIVLSACGVWQAIATLRRGGYYAGILLGYACVMAGLYLTGGYYLFNKVSPFAILLLLVSVSGTQSGAPGSFQTVFGKGVAARAMLVAIAAMSIWGLLYLNSFYVYAARERQTYVDRSIEAFRDKLSASVHGQVRVFAEDASSERHLLLRQLFASAYWRPERDENIWPEFRLRDGLPAELREGPFDFLMVANDYRGPVDYSALDADTFVGQLGPKVDVFGAGSMIIEFDEKWSSGPWTKLAEKRFTRGMVLKGSAGTMSIMVQGSARDMKLTLNSSPENDVGISLNGSGGIRSIPLTASGTATVTFECAKLCRPGVNSLEWTQAGSLLELTDISSVQP